jgi:hypothetical protein
MSRRVVEEKKEMGRENREMKEKMGEMGIRIEE